MSEEHRDEESALSPRTQTALENAGVSPEDAANMHPDDLAKLPGIGPVAVGQILGPEHLEIEHHDASEAEAADAEHHPVSDPPNIGGAPVVPHGTRAEDDYGRASHTERINPEQVAHVIIDANGRRWLTDAEGKLRPLTGGPAHMVISYAAEGHPADQRWPYVTTQPSVNEHVLRPPGSVVWLLPHEVAAFHRPAPR